MSFTVKNTGKLPGAEVSQLYVSAHTGGMFSPEKELKGFARTYLQPGEEKRVVIKLGQRSYAVWSIAENAWVVETGDYEILVGASSADIRLRREIHMDAEPVKNPYVGREFEPYYAANVKNMPDESFKALLGRELPPDHWDRSAPLGFNDTLYQGRYLDGGLGRLIYLALDLYCRGMTAVGRRDKANWMAFIMNMPYRNLGRMSGILSDAQVYAMLNVVNRKKGAWKKFAHTLKAGRK